MKRLTFWLRESSSSKPSRVDHENAVVFGVKIIGKESANTHGHDVDGSEYTDEALREAIKLYEGAMVNVNHLPRKGPPVDRSAYDRCGKFQGVEARKDGLYGDLHLLKAHPMTPRILEAADKMPDLFGMSHHARGEGEKRGRKFVIHRIEEVVSVDVVADGATTESLFESREKGRKKPMKTTFAKFLESWSAKADSKLDAGKRKIVAKLLEDDEVGGAEMDAPAEGGDHEDMLAGGFRAACLAVYDDEGLDDKAKLGKIKDLLAMKAKLLASDSSEGDDEEDVETEESEDEKKDSEDTDLDEEDDEEEKPKAKDTKESLLKLAKKNPAVRKLLEQNDRARAAAKARKDRARVLKVCESLGLPEKYRSKVFMETLVAQPNETVVRQLVADRKKLVGIGKPRSGYGGTGTNDAAPTKVNAKEITESLRG